MITILTDLLWTFLSVVRDVLPIAAVLLLFQLVILRKPIPHPKKVALGMFYVLLGLALARRVAQCAAVRWQKREREGAR